MGAGRARAAVRAAAAVVLAGAGPAGARRGALPCSPAERLLSTPADLRAHASPPSYQLHGLAPALPSPATLVKPRPWQGCTAGLSDPPQRGRARASPLLKSKPALAAPCSSASHPLLSPVVTTSKPACLPRSHTLHALPLAVRPPTLPAARCPSRLLPCAPPLRWERTLIVWPASPSRCTFFSLYIIRAPPPPR